MHRPRCCRNSGMELYFCHDTASCTKSIAPVRITDMECSETKCAPAYECLVCVVANRAITRPLVQLTKAEGRLYSCLSPCEAHKCLWQAVLSLIPLSSSRFLKAVVLPVPNQAHKPSRQAVHGQGKEAESQNRIKSFMCIMDSMTEKELDSANPKLMEAQSRIIRISRGSGRAPGEVVMLLGTPPTVVTMTVGTWG